MKTVHIVIGTRPEAIKMAPVVIALRQNPRLNVRLISTGQHRELLQQALSSFGLVADHDLKVMRPKQTLSGVTARILTGLEKVFSSESPHLVLAHGDTTTCYSTALSAFYHSIPFFHVEAGLRTFRLDSPFPEEFNRQCVARLARHHFAPTEEAKKNLMGEGVSESSVSVIGSTVYDAISLAQKKMERPLQELSRQLRPYSKRVVVTLHRRENGGQSVVGVLEALRQSAVNHPDALFVYPIHPTPRIRELALDVLGGQRNIVLTAPLEYPHFLSLIAKASLIVTDSGGVQEEASYFGKPTLIVRQTTERQDGITGHTRIIGTDPQRLLHHMDEVLSRKETPHTDILRSGRSASALVAEVVSQRYA